VLCTQPGFYCQQQQPLVFELGHCMLLLRSYNYGVLCSRPAEAAGAQDTEQHQQELGQPTPDTPQQQQQQWQQLLLGYRHTTASHL